MSNLGRLYRTIPEETQFIVSVLYGKGCRSIYKQNPFRKIALFRYRHSLYVEIPKTPWWIL